MAKNPIAIIRATDNALANLQTRLEATEKLLISISEQARKAGKALGTKTAGGTAKEVESRSVAERKLLAIQKERKKIIEATITAMAKRRTAASGWNKILQKIRIETQILNKQSREQAILTSKITSEYQKLVVRMNQAGRVYQSLIAKQAQGIRLSTKEKLLLKQKATEFNRYERAVRKADRAIKRHHRNVGNYNTRLGKLRNTLMTVFAAFGVMGGITLFATMIQDAFSLTKKLDSMSFSMKTIIKDADELGTTQRWLRTITNNFGAELVNVTNRFIKFRAASQSAGFSARVTQKIFASLTKAAGVLGLRTDELQGIFLALEQMISKGKITTEELRRQLGERLPGAMDIMAKSMNVTTAELDQLLKKGLVFTKDVLPAFAEEVEKAYGIESVVKIQTLQAATIRLKNAWTILVEDFSKGNNVSQKLMRVFDFLATNLKKVVETVFKVIKAFIIYKAIMLAAGAITATFTAIMTAMELRILAVQIGLKAATLQMNLFNIATKANPLGIVIAVLGAAVGAFIAFRDSTDEATIALENFNKQLAILDTEASKIEAALDTFAEGNLRAGAAANAQRVIEIDLNKKLKKLLVEQKLLDKGGEELTKKELEQIQTIVNWQLTSLSINKNLTKEQILQDLNQSAFNEKTKKAIALAQTQFNTADRILLESVDKQKEIDDKKDDISEAAAKKLRKSALALAKFRVEQVIKANDLIAKNDRLSEKERLQAVSDGMRAREDLAKVEMLGVKNDPTKNKDDVLLAAETHESKLTEIVRKGNEERDKIINASAKKVLDNWQEIQDAIDDADLQDSINADINNFMQELSQNIGTPIEELFEEFNRLYEWDFENFKKFAKKKTDDAETEAEKQKSFIIKLVDTGQEMLGAFGEFGSAMFDRRIQRYDDEIQKSNDFYANLLDNENLTEQKRSAIEAKRDANTAKIEKRKRQEQGRQARFNKAIAVTQTIIDTAQAIAEANPIIPLMVFAAFTGAAQLATIIAQPIPKYAKGKGAYDDYEGVAIWGEKGREAKISKDGTLELSPKRKGNHLTYVKKDDVIHPNADRLLSSLTYEDAMHRSYLFSRNQTGGDYLMIGDVIASKLNTQNDKMVNALNKKKMSFKLNQTINLADDIDFLGRLNKTL